jgi:hypothetical protein
MTTLYRFVLLLPYSLDTLNIGTVGHMRSLDRRALDRRKDKNALEAAPLLHLGGAWKYTSVIGKPSGFDSSAGLASAQSLVRKAKHAPALSSASCGRCTISPSIHSPLPFRFVMPTKPIVSPPSRDWRMESAARANANGMRQIVSGMEEEKSRGREARFRELAFALHKCTGAVLNSQTICILQVRRSGQQ